MISLIESVILSNRSSHWNCTQCSFRPEKHVIGQVLRRVAYLPISPQQQKQQPQVNHHIGIMVKISQDMLLNHTRHTKRRTNETPEQYLKRLTHIYLQESNIEEIDNLNQCRSLSVLYLYDNKISGIKNLGFASNLTHLYLQKNRITRITGLKHLQRLTKLYIGKYV